MKDFKPAQAEMDSIVDGRSVLKAFERNIAPAADRAFELGDEALVCLRVSILKKTELCKTKLLLY